MKQLKTPHPISRRQRVVGSMLTAGLGAIAIVILITQAHYDPNRWQAPTGTTGRASLDSISRPAGPVTPSHSRTHTGNNPGKGVPTLQPWDQVAGLRPLGAAEHYDAVTLSDKINGKAELYLSAGFQELETRRFAFADQPGLWLERYVYSMDSYSGAFSVFSQQRRPGATVVGITQDAYRSANGLFLVHGPYYLELIASDTADFLWPAMAALAAAFIENHAVAQSNRDESALFPTDGLVVDSISLTTTNAFGFSRLDQVYSARYQQQDSEVTAFISKRQSSSEAAALTGAYVDFLIEYDARHLIDPQLDEQMYLLDVFGTYEIVFHQGSYLAGVHEADNLEHGMLVARQLRDNLKGAAQ